VCSRTSQLAIPLVVQSHSQELLAGTVHLNHPFELLGRRSRLTNHHAYGLSGKKQQRGTDPTMALFIGQGECSTLTPTSEFTYRFTLEWYLMIKEGWHPHTKKTNGQPLKTGSRKEGTLTVKQVAIERNKGGSLRVFSGPTLSRLQVIPPCQLHLASTSFPVPT
jgi:hypothetical protein